MMATPTMHRSAHGLTSGGDGVDWRVHGACGRPDVDPDLWLEGHAGWTQEALHICLTHCEVMVQCHRYAISEDRLQRRSMVLGGRSYNQFGYEDRWQSCAATCRICDPQAFVDPEEARKARRRSKDTERKRLRRAAA